MFSNPSSLGKAFPSPRSSDSGLPDGPADKGVESEPDSDDSPNSETSLESFTVVGTPNKETPSDGLGRVLQHAGQQV